jgi:CelD/BcsL family acetyltransferase involved in cellulose biosynthesis
MREGATHAFIDYLLDHRNEWHMLDLTEVRSDSPTVRVFEERLAASGYRVEITQRSSQPYERWEEGASFDHYMRGSTRRKNWLRDLRWLERQPGGAIEVVTDPQSVPSAFTAFMRLHSLRWTGSGGSDAITGPHIEAFHRDATQFLAESGKLALYLMKLDGKEIASIYGLRHGESFYYYQSGRDPAWNHRSVSAALLAATFRDTMQSGLREYDMLGGLEPYKQEWVTGMRHTCSVRVYDPSGPGRHLARHERISRLARDLTKRALPRPIADKLRLSMKRET